MLHNYLTEDFKLIQSLADPCVYSKTVNGFQVIVIGWVDIILAFESIEILERIKSSMCQRFKMKDLGILSWFLGIEFKRSCDCIEMKQTCYI